MKKSKEKRDLLTEDEDVVGVELALGDDSLALWGDLKLTRGIRDAMKLGLMALLPRVIHIISRGNLALAAQGIPELLDLRLVVLVIFGDVELDGLSAPLVVDGLHQSSGLDALLARALGSLPLVELETSIEDKHAKEGIEKTETRKNTHTHKRLTLRCSETSCSWAPPSRGHGACP